MKVTIRLHEASEPLVFEDALNTYTKGPMFCLRLPDRVTLKWPLVGIVHVREEGGFTSQKKTPVMPYTVEIETPKPKPEPELAKDGLTTTVWARIHADGSGRVYSTKRAAMAEDLGYPLLMRVTHDCAFSSGDEDLWNTLVDRLCEIREGLQPGDDLPVTKLVVKEPPRTAPTYAACGKNTATHCPACALFDEEPTVPYVEANHSEGTIRFELVGASFRNFSSTWEATSGACVVVFKNGRDSEWSAVNPPEPEDRTALSERVVGKMRDIVWPTPS